eukprot:TRINITY_DN11176_c0_g1_i1.p1 TRINITY_DN11176_c0_g1~~TRINITY_DN11176_c0_g1_i1.p1  ORF type:complete len:89 (-),score=4.84 TRINITY_DN11176_c0_g1_i1:222-488(-)
MDNCFDMAESFLQMQGFNRPNVAVDVPVIFCHPDSPQVYLKEPISFVINVVQENNLFLEQPKEDILTHFLRVVKICALQRACVDEVTL